MKLGSKTLVIVLLFVGLVLVNYLASSLPVRVDTTAESIYTLSSGTKTLLGKIEEPVVVDFYFSKSATGVPISYKNYAARVQEMLRQYARASRGKLTLNVIDPRPDTPEEEKATAAGLQPQLLPSGEQVYFGIIATQADQQKNLAALNPQREQFLEYDLSKLIYSVQQIDKKKLGLLTSLPIQGDNMDQQMMMMMRRQPTPGQFVADEWGQSFDIIKVDASAAELPANLDILAVIHPENVSPKLQYAIDQFLLSGKPVFLALDPSSQYFKRQGGQQQMMGAPAQNVSSDLPTLLGAYGIAYDPQKVVGDIASATQVQTGAGTITRYPIWLNLRRDNFSAKSMATAQLSSAMFIEAGSISPKQGSTLTFTPLAETTDQGGELPSMSLQFAQPDDIAGQLKPSGKKTIAALVTGKFKSAFPEGAPREEPKPDEKKDDKKPEPAKPAADSLKESKSTSTLFVIADTDWLFDDYSVRKMNFFGQSAAEPINDNLAFASNTVEFLSGSQDLISIRGKGSSLRPFTVVRAMEVEAQKKYQSKLTGLDARLQKVQAQLTELQGKKGDSNRLVASPEVTKAIEDFQKQSAQMKGERREIRRALREDIDALENKLLFLNLAASPLLVLAFGFWFYRTRRA